MPIRIQKILKELYQKISIDLSCDSFIGRNNLCSMCINYSCPQISDMERANYVFELHGCPKSLLDDMVVVEGVLELEGYPEFKKVVSYDHMVDGVTIIGSDNGSSIAIHTWPRDGQVSISIITDEDKHINGRYDSLKNAFQATSGRCDKWVF